MILLDNLDVAQWIDPRQDSHISFFKLQLSSIGSKENIEIQYQLSNVKNIKGNNNKMG